ncbi:hypothetical protein I302_100457 [Kwoniella bestiolae CBS 10118]|uniref:Uncharacterized protein n=1 Tax=Kwoniella bestiolae CBS 10118 TaxID=1296100 RepID=A0A1B9G566_9TREE|nr:hypothetical protein I302_03831 [Kwoniella bestiolae CBS 10118]OCF26153.1 hypothetical protein I302_03831 [Kwoniella bestiolae CBS 10118]
MLDIHLKHAGPDPMQYTIVNSGCLWALAPAPAISSREELGRTIKGGIRHWMEFGAKMQASSEAEPVDTLRGMDLLKRAEELAERVECLSMEEYLERGDWRDTFELGQVEGWFSAGAYNQPLGLFERLSIMQSKHNKSNETTRSTRTTVTIPLELLERIVKNVQDDQRVLAKFCLVSRTALELAGPLLYREMSISPFGRNSTHQGEQASYRLFAPNRMVKYLEKTEALKIDTHEAGWCRAQTLSVPKLFTLTLTPSPAITSDGLYAISSMDPDHHNLSHHCKLLDTLRPKRLIIRNANVLDIRIREGTPPELLEEVEELIFISTFEVSPAPPAPTAPWNRTRLPRFIKLRKFTWIFWTNNNYDALDTWKLTSKDQRRKGKTSILSKSLEHLGSTIINLFDPLNTEITIVNLGCLRGLESPKCDPRDVGPRAEISIEAALGRMCPATFSGAWIVRERIRFLTMNEYLNREDWKEDKIFHQEEVRGWI